MLIERLRLRNFTRHASTDVELPACGIVTVTGENGSGKSSLSEAVAVGLWGKTLRGADPWQKGVEGSVVIEAQGVVAERRRSKGGKTTLAWNPAGQDGAQYETTTKAQAALETVVGTFEVWRRSHVFSSHDAANFTGATDGERKRFLEAVLGLEFYDRALELCRQDLKAVLAKVAAVQQGLRLAQAGAVSATQRLDDVRRRLAEVDEQGGGDLASLRERVKKLEVLLLGCGVELRELAGRGGEAEKLSGRLQAECAAAARQAAALDRDACPTCGQAIPEAVRGPLRAALQRAQEARDAAEQAGAADREVVAEQVRQVTEEQQGLREKLGQVKANLATQERALDVWARLAKEARDREAELERAQAEVVRLGAEDGAVGQDVKLLEACEAVLGLRGVRAHILGRALAGIEQAANAWLGQVAGPGLTLLLSPYAEKKTGGVTDAIALQVEGAGGGNGYGALSGGERRRVDVALLLALADVAAAAAGRRPGTLWLDEVADSLDLDGCERLAGALADMARSRPVVLISHNPALVEAVPAVLRLHVQEGVVAGR